MHTLTKKERYAHLFTKHAAIFRCPVCSESMHVADQKSLLCDNHHCFDLAKQGYIHLLAQSHKTKYDKGLFEARSAISNIGFFDPLLDRIGDYIAGSMQATKPHAVQYMMDAGCGEGSHLAALQKKLSRGDSSGAASKAIEESHIAGIGLDIAKEGIQFAAKHDTNTMWCVADLANCPIADKQLRFILNILSPSNYAEFTRLLADDGEIIKVIPESGYLKELREIFYEQSEREAYSNEKTLLHFSRSFKLARSERVQYRVPLDRSALAQLIRMTPLSWGASNEAKEQALERGITEISCDFTILIGKK